MSLKIEEVQSAGINPGRDTLKLIIKHTDAALASGLPREEVIERLKATGINPQDWTGDLLYSDVAHRLAEK